MAFGHAASCWRLGLCFQGETALNLRNCEIWEKAARGSIEKYPVLDTEINPKNVLAKLTKSIAINRSTFYTITKANVGKITGNF